MYFLIGDKLNIDIFEGMQFIVIFAIGLVMLSLFLYHQDLIDARIKITIRPRRQILQ